MPDRAPRSSLQYARWLWVLLALFVLRVVAQPLALILPAGIVPPFEAWHSGAVPYALLVAAQILIVGLSCLGVCRVMYQPCRLE